MKARKPKAKSAKKRGQRADELGHLAEADVNRWFARQPGWTWDQVGRDRAGIDGSCTWTGGVSTASPLADLALPLYFTAVIQVKASDDLSRNRPRLSLERALRLVQHPGPAFVLLLDYASTKDPVRTQLIHLSGELVRTILKSIATVDNLQLNERSVILSEAYSIDVATPFDAHLADAIRLASGISPGRYTQAKLDETRRLVEETRVGSASISGAFRTADIEQDLIDFALGERDQVRMVPSGPLTLRMRGNERIIHAADVVFGRGRATEVTVEASGGGLRTAFPAELFHTHSMFPYLPKAKEQIRLRGEFVTLDMIGPPNTGHVTVNFSSPREAVNLRRLSTEAMVLLIADRVASKELKVELTLSVGAGKGSLKFRPATGLRDEDRRRFNHYAIAGRLAREAGIAESLSLNPELLDQQSQALDIAGAIVSTELQAPITCELVAGDKPLPVGESYAVRLVSRVILGEHVVVALGLVRGTLKQLSDEPVRAALVDPFVQCLVVKAWPYVRTAAQRHQLDEFARATFEDAAEGFAGYWNAREIGAVVY